VTAPANTPQAAPEAVHAELVDRFATFPDPIPAILRQTPPGEILRTDLYDLPKLDRWWQGRTVLLGDAAHAMTPNLGQGGAQAIEDAYCLAGHLATAPTIEEGSRAYQQSRLSRVRWVSQTAWRLGQAAHLTNPMLRWLRDLALRATPSWYGDLQVHRLARLPE
jgi:2-polyprenyl-6-methoxyphenol hydroxylase-like FAD-dependent oxidoreductase